MAIREPGLRVQVASALDREGVVAELWQDDEMVAEVSIADGRLFIELYPRPGGGPWRFLYSDLIRGLEEASLRLGS